MLYGILNLSFWGYVLITVMMCQLTIVAVTLYLHRSQTHRALDLHPAISHVFRFWLWLTTGMRTKDWVAVHRKHHAKCETPEDPHSPQLLGIRKVFFQGAELYRKEIQNQETLDRYGNGTPNDWLERRIYSPHSGAGLFLLFCLDLILFGIPGITIWAIQMMLIPFFAAGVVNGIGHYWGYRNFECPDASRNIIPWGFIIAGEELHNNHHTYPTSAKFSVKWWEVDVGWGYIRFLQMLRLAKVKRVPPVLHKVPEKSHVDMDTLKALITGRFQLMAHYSREVILPAWQEEKYKAGVAGQTLLKKAKTLLTRADSLLDEMSKRTLTHVLEGRQKLQTVYQFRLRLQEIWTRTTATQRELLDSLQQWCKEAEATGIYTLKKFAAELVRYSMGKQIITKTE